MVTNNSCAAVIKLTGDNATVATQSSGNINLDGHTNAGATVNFSGSSTTLSLNVTDTSTNTTFIGASAGNSTRTGTSNTSLGYITLTNLTTADSCSAFGRASQFHTTTGSFNTSFGSGSLQANTTGASNTGVGYISLSNLDGGSNNIAIGESSGNLYSSTESSNILIGNAGTLGDNNTIRIGIQGAGAGRQNKCFIAGIASVSVSNLNVVTIDTTTGQLGSQAASSGDVVGPASATNTAIALFNGTTGKLIKNSVPTVDSSGNLTIAESVAAEAQIFLSNNAANAAADSCLMLQQGSGTAGSNAFTRYTCGAGNSYAVGQDTSNHEMRITYGANVTATPTTGTNLFKMNTTGTITLATALPVASGGTGASTLTGLLFGNGTSAVTTKSFSVVEQVFTSTGTYTPTSGMVYCTVRVIGGGGAGGGAAASGVATGSVGAGGGGGEYAEGVFSSATVGASQAVTIAAAATGVSGAGGNNGGTCSLGALITAAGGTGGAASGAAGITNAAGGAGGTGGSGGSFRTPGQTGAYGYANIAASVTILEGGYGGSSQLGAGGSVSNSGASNQGAAGTGKGSGGGGSCNYTSQSALLGGAGAQGVVIVTEYVLA